MISFSQKMDFQENVKFFLVDQFLWNVLYWVFSSDLFIHLFIPYF